MSLSNVLPYFRSVMNSLNHSEWKDALSDDNIPSNLLDRAYHLLLEDASPIKQNQDVIEINQPISVKLYVKGFRTTSDGRDRAVLFQEGVIKKALEDARRCTTYVGIKNVLFVGGGIRELSSDNDNIMRVTLNFNCIVMMANA